MLSPPSTERVRRLALSRSRAVAECRHRRPSPLHEAASPVGVPQWSGSCQWHSRKPHLLQCLRIYSISIKSVDFEVRQCQRQGGKRTKEPAPVLESPMKHLTVHQPSSASSSAARSKQTRTKELQQTEKQN